MPRFLLLFALLFVPLALLPRGEPPTRRTAPAPAPGIAVAPMPRSADFAAFGSTGFLSRADLEHVRFDSRAVDDGRTGDPASAMLFADRLRAMGDLAVFLPRTAYRSGDSIPVYFVLKNNTDEPSGFSSGLFLFPPFRTAWNDFAIRVRNCDTGETDGIEGGGCLLGGVRITRPANGYFVARTDFGLAHGKPRPPGEYEVSWSHWTLHSAPVRFTVAPTRGEPPVPPVPRASAAFYLVEPVTEHKRYPRGAGEPFVWERAHLHALGAGEIASGLSVGHNGHYVPDLNTLPATDGRVRAVAEWKRYRAGERLAVTLHAADPRAPVRFTQVPRVYLQLSDYGENVRLSRWDEEHADPGPRPDTLTTPLTLEVQLPPDWRERTRLNDTQRAAVLVASERITLPNDDSNIWSGKDAPKPPRDPAAWSGVVRTAFTELTFPPRRPRGAALEIP